MATNRIVQAVYDLKDNITGKLQSITHALGLNRAESSKTAASVERDNKRTSESYKQTADALGFLRENLGKIAAAAAAAMAAMKAVDFGVDSFRGAAEVEQSLARIKAIAQTTGEDFERLGQQIDRSAIAANVSTQQAAAAAAELAQQGQSAADIFQTLTPTLLLAKGANLELAEAAGVVDDALDLFGKNAGDAALMVDQLVAASQGSKDGLSGLATAMRTLAPDARSMGLSFEQLVGMLGVFGQNGIDAGKAARGLRTIFQDLQDPASKFSTALSSLGDSTGDFGHAIETVRNAGRRGEDALLSLDGASRSLVQFLLQQAPGAVDAFTASLAAAGGTASRTAKILDATFKGAFASFGNALDRLGEGLLETALEPFRVELEKLAAQLTAFADSPAFDDLKKTLATLFQEGTAAFDNFIQSIDWNQLVDGAEDAFKRTATSIGEFKDDLSTVAEALNKIGATVGVVYRSIAVVFDTAKLGISKLVEVKFSELAALSAAVDGVTGSSSKLTIALESVRDAAKDAVDKGLTSFAEDTEKVTENLKALAATADETAPKVDHLAASFGNVRAGSASTAAAASTAVDGFDAIAAGVDNAALALGILPELFTEDANAARSATDAHQAHAQQILAARQAVEEARASLKALAESGERNSVAFQQASNALQQAQAELDRLTGKAEQATRAQRTLEDAFSGLKIASQAKLQDAAAAATRHFETIRQAFAAGQVSIEDVRRAFEAYAQQQRAAVADSDAWVKNQLDGQLAVAAATLGLSDKLKQAGESGRRAGDETAAAFDRAKGSIEATSDASQDLAQSTTNAANAADRIGESAKAAGASFDSVVALTKEQIHALRQMSDEIVRSGSLQSTSLEEAKRLLESMGGLVNGHTQLLTQRINELENAALRAEQVAGRMANEAASIQDQIDQINGDDASIEDRRHERKLADLKAEAEAAGQLGTAAYLELVALENKLHDLKVSNIRKQAQEVRSEDQRGSGDGGRGSGAGSLQERTRIVEQVVNLPDIKIGGKNVSRFSASDARQLADLMANDPSVALAFTNAVMKTFRRSASAAGVGAGWGR